MKKQLGHLETRFFAYIQLRRLHVVRSDEVAKALGLAAHQEHKLLMRLAGAGMIARVWRGVYLVPPRLPLGGAWSPGEALALSTLMKVLSARYQVCGPNAFNRYGYIGQIPNRLYAYNDRISGERTVGSVALSLIKVAEARLGATETVVTGDGVEMTFASRARTLVDAVYDWARFGSLPDAYEWIRSDVAKGTVSVSELARLTLLYGDKGTIRRMGMTLEQTGISPALLRKLERALPPSSSFIPWVPTFPKRGVRSARWGVVMNDGI